MSYEHCDVHDEDATNGCVYCWHDWFDGLSDAEFLRALYDGECSTHDTDLRAMVADRVASIIGKLPPDRRPLCRYCGALAKDHVRLYCFRGKLYENWPALVRVLNETQGIKELHEFTPLGDDA